MKATFDSGSTLQAEQANDFADRGAAADELHGYLIVAGKSSSAVRVTVAKISTAGAVVTA